MEKGLNENLYNTIKDRVLNHKKLFFKMFTSRYHEMIPSLIIYENNKTAIDFFKVEVMLMQGYDIVIGANKFNDIQILGFCKKSDTFENPINFLSEKLVNKKDIIFTIPKQSIPDKMNEITYLDDCETGNFTVIRNKTLNLLSDSLIIEYYTDEISEIVTSRYSLTMQAKIITFFIGEENDESINQLVTDLYNGSPIVKVGKFFDPEEQIYHMKNEGISSTFSELKREYQNKVSELNNMLGINSIAVEKESGVSDAEVHGNRAYTTSIANIKLESREHALKKLNKRYNLNINCLYNDEVASEFNEVNNLKGDLNGK